MLEIGRFKVISAPLNSLGGLDTESFKREALVLAEENPSHYILDIGSIDFLYSDAFNAFHQVQQKLASKNGSLGILASDELARKSMLNSQMDRVLKIYAEESDILAESQFEPKPTAAQVSIVDIVPSVPATPNPEIAKPASFASASPKFWRWIFALIVLLGVIAFGLLRA